MTSIPLSEGKAKLSALVESAETTHEIIEAARAEAGDSRVGGSIGLNA